MPKANEVLSNEVIAEKVNRYCVYAPFVARRWRPGQFVILRIDEDGERIPLTVVEVDPDAGTIVLIVQAVGKTTYRMAQVRAGEQLADLVGPLGSPTHIERYGTVVVVGGGIGIAPAYPIAGAMKEQGNRVVGILGARSRNLLILENEMRRVCSEVFICTDDGSYGRRGLVTEVLQDYVQNAGKPDLVVAIGPAIMMKCVSLMTKEFGIPTVVSLNPIMIDGTGMCGGCRVSVGGRTKFGCVDGPEFDGHLVDFDELMKRQAFYRQQEKEALERFEKECRLKGALGRSGA